MNADPHAQDATRYRFYLGERLQVNGAAPFNGVRGEVVDRHRSHGGTVCWYRLRLDKPVGGERHYTFIEGSLSHA